MRTVCTFLYYYLLLSLYQACVFNGVYDPSPANPFFYTSSVNLAAAWGNKGNPVETSYHVGGHCSINSRQDIVQCLDDSTGRLMVAEPATTDTTTDTTLAPPMSTTSDPDPLVCTDTAPPPPPNTPTQQWYVSVFLFLFLFDFCWWV